METKNDIEMIIDVINSIYEPCDPERYEAINKIIKEKYDILAEVEL